MIKFHSQLSIIPAVYETATLQDNLEHSGGITICWNSNTNTEIPLGAYITYGGLRWIMLEPYRPNKASAVHWRYEPTFSHPQQMLSRVPFWIKSTDAEGHSVNLRTTSFTGYAYEIAQKVAGFFADYGAIDPYFSATFGAWTTNLVGTTGNGSQSLAKMVITVSFDACTLKQAIDNIANALGCNVYMDWTTPRTIRYMAATTLDGDTYTHFHVLGGTKNMGKITASGSYSSVTQRMTLDETEYPHSIMPAINDNDTSIRLIRDLVFDDIYPKMELYIKSVRQRLCYCTDENGEKVVDHWELNSAAVVNDQPVTEDTVGATPVYKLYAKWYIRLSTDKQGEHEYLFDSSKLINDKPLSLLFQPNYDPLAETSPLVGRQFELTYFAENTPEWQKDDVLSREYPFVAQQGEYRIAFIAEGDQILPTTTPVVGSDSYPDLNAYIDYYSGTSSNPPSVTEGGLIPHVGNLVTLVNVALGDTEKGRAKTDLATAGQQVVNMMANRKGESTETFISNAPSVGNEEITGLMRGVVTNINQNLDTGVAEVTWGSWGRKTLTGSLSDKVDAVSVSTGAATETSENTKMSSDELGAMLQTMPKTEMLLIADLSNQMESVACTYDGKLDNGSHGKDLYTKLSVFYGTKDVSSVCTFVCNTEQQGFSLWLEEHEGDTTSTNPITTNNPTSLAQRQWVRIHYDANVDVAEVNEIAFAVTHAMYGTRNVSLIINGVRAGSPGAHATLYFLLPDYSSVVKKSDDSLVPATVTCQRKKSYNGTVDNTTDGYLCYVKDNGAETPYPAAGIPTSGLTDSITIYYYDQQGADRKLWDMEKVPIVTDGKDGQDMRENLIDHSEPVWSADVTSSSATSGNRYYTTDKTYDIAKLPPDGTKVSGQCRLTLTNCVVEDGAYIRLYIVGSTDETPKRWCTVYFSRKDINEAGTVSGTFDIKSENLTKQNDAGGTWSGKVQVHAHNFTSGTIAVERVKLEVGEKCSAWCLSENDKRITKKSEVSEYQVADSGTTTPSGTWQSTKQAAIDAYNTAHSISGHDWQANTFMWTRTTITWSDGSSTTIYSAERNPNDGQDGMSISIMSQSVGYSKQSSGNLVPQELEYGNFPETLSNGDWLYSKTYVAYQNSIGQLIESTNTYSVSYIGTDGEDGADGDEGRGISSVVEYYAISNSKTIAPDDNAFDTIFNPPTKDNPYLWNYELVTYTKGTPATSKSTKQVIGTYSKDGRGIDSIVNHYLATNASSGVTKETQGWTTSVQPITPSNRYLWNYETTTYTEADAQGHTTSETEPHIIGVYGTGVLAQYAPNNNPSSEQIHTTWQSGDIYMRTMSTDDVSWSTWQKFVGEDGSDGDYTDFTFAISAETTTANASTAPSDISSWNDGPVPTTTAKPYLWSKQVRHTFTGGSETTSTPKYFRLTGEKGKDGADGEDSAKYVDLVTEVAEGIWKIVKNCYDSKTQAGTEHPSVTLYLDDSREPSDAVDYDLWLCHDDYNNIYRLRRKDPSEWTWLLDVNADAIVLLRDMLNPKNSITFHSQLITSDVEKYDIYFKQSTFHDNFTNTDIFGGIGIWVYYDSVWQLVRDNTSGVLENYGDHIVRAVFGSAPLPNVDYASSMITTKNTITQLAGAYVGGKTLAEALFDMGVEAVYYLGNTQVYLNPASTTGWSYSTPSTTPIVEVADADVDSIVSEAQSHMKFAADNIDFDSSYVNVKGNLKASDNVIFIGKMPDGRTIEDDVIRFYRPAVTEGGLIVWPEIEYVKISGRDAITAQFGYYRSGRIEVKGYNRTMDGGQTNYMTDIWNGVVHSNGFAAIDQDDTYFYGVGSADNPETFVANGKEITVMGGIITGIEGKAPLSEYSGDYYNTYLRRSIYCEGVIVTNPIIVFLTESGVDKISVHSNSSGTFISVFNDDDSEHTFVTTQSISASIFNKVVLSILAQAKTAFRSIGYNYAIAGSADTSSSVSDPNSVLY